MRLLAVDPGPSWAGWCVLDVDASAGIRCTHVASGLTPVGLDPFLRLLLGHAIEAVAVEAPRGYAFQPARVPGLLDTSRVAGGMLWVAESRGLPTVECSAQQVRKTLAGKATANDAMVRDVLRRNVFGCPATPSDHVADAMAVGVLGAWMLCGRVSRTAGGTNAKSHAAQAVSPKRPARHRAAG